MVGQRSHPHWKPRIIAIAGGKGGVGKSTIATNLALAIGRAGHRTTLVDADLGAANLHTMLGMLHPTVGLADFIDQRIDSLDEARIKLSVPTVSLVPGSSRPGSADLTRAEKLRLLRGIAELDTDCVIIDVGAGTSYNVVDLVAAADIKLFVLTPQLPSLNNAYGLLKACVHRVVRRLASDEMEQNLIDSALGHETKARTIPQLLSVLEPLDRALTSRIADTLDRFGVGLIGNQIETDTDAAALLRMSPLIHDHLQIHAPVMASIRRSAALSGGLRAGSRTVATRGDETEGAFRRLAQLVHDVDLRRLRGNAQSPTSGTIPLWIVREEASPPPR